MEEDQVVEQQDDLERMIAHMRAEALKRGKDWLRAKMEDKSLEPAERKEVTTAPTSLADKAAEQAPLPPEKPGRRQRSEGKQSRKPNKKARVVIQSTDDATAATPEASRPRAPAEGEHINAIIKESLAPLLLRGDGAGPAIEGTQPIDRQASIPAIAIERPPPSDPLTAWGAASKGRNPTLNAGNPPDTYARPSLGPPSMTTRAAGLATAIPLTPS
ncbi:hypothetical protein NDU88_006044 [Pleurodeles waltl]|uniref:Uncharacterized protein n=1 Tax=Pleurodeles waltl TaxID=8319 RepID=A0AAV7QGJ9_PLEWA|nr:hypothetical protein NDU88_006044 [Pleurodeles waltl]